MLGQVYEFKDVKDVLAKASEKKSGDELAGVAAESKLQRIAAKEVLGQLTVGDLREIRQFLMKRILLPESFRMT